jgi:hypothetical protein
VSQPQIYRIDDLLIRAALATLVAAAALVLVVHPWDGRSSPAAQLWLALAAAAPVALLIGGLSVRRREARILAVWRLLERSLEVDVTALMRASTFTREELVRAVRMLNDRGLGHYVWDDDADVVRDGRLAVRVAHDADCASCGAAVSVTRNMTAAPACPYCAAPLGAADVNRMKQGIMESLRPAAATGSAQSPVAVAAPQGRRMSLWLFLLLLVFCWPAALVYAIYCNR